MGFGGICRSFPLIQNTGRFEEALELVEERKDYIRRAGLGPWTQLLVKA